MSDDARSFHLFLTESGQVLRDDIDRDVTDQVSRALEMLASPDRLQLIQCLTLYVEALQSVNQERTY